MRSIVDVVVLELTKVMVVFSCGDFATVAYLPKRVVEVVALMTHPILRCRCSRAVLHLRKPNQYYLIRYPLNLFYSAIRKTLVQISGYSRSRIHLPRSLHTLFLSCNCSSLTADQTKMQVQNPKILLKAILFRGSSICLIVKIFKYGTPSLLFFACLF